MWEIENIALRKFNRYYTCGEAPGSESCIIKCAIRYSIHWQTKEDLVSKYNGSYLRASLCKEICHKWKVLWFSILGDDKSISGALGKSDWGALKPEK